MKIHYEKAQHPAYSWVMKEGWCVAPYLGCSTSWSLRAASP